MTPFNAAAFCILMDHHKGGVEKAHPEYIREKLETFEHCSADTAAAMLDGPNQIRLRRWCLDWNQPWPGDPQ